MRSLVYRPSSQPPVPDRDLKLYAGKWVVVRGGKVVLQAASHNALVTKCKPGEFKDGDRILQLPPVAS